MTPTTALAGLALVLVATIASSLAAIGGNTYEWAPPAEITTSQV